MSRIEERDGVRDGRVIRGERGRCEGVKVKEEYGELRKIEDDEVVLSKEGERGK